MDTAAAAMLEAGVGRFRGPSLAALLAEMWAPLAVALAAIATLPSLLRRLQVLILRLRSRGKEVISSHISTYYSSGDDYSDGEEVETDDDDDDDAVTGSSGEEEDEVETERRRIGYFEGAHDGAFAWGGCVVRTWQGLPRRLSVGKLSSAGIPAVRLWGASTASGGGVDDDARWDADEGGRAGAAAEAPVVVGWRRDHAPRRRRRLLPVQPK